jgi:hypothetical protein
MNWQRQQRVILRQNHKIDMIKAFRCLTRVLGKLDICPRFIHDHAEEDRQRSMYPHVMPRPPWRTERYTYGLGLKEAKDWVEFYLERIKANKSQTDNR